MVYKYEVFVDDNFHYMDLDERFKLGDFEDLESAILACKRIVDQDLLDFEKDLKVQGRETKLYDNYVTFGSDPFIITDDPKAGVVPFSAWDYAKEQCEKKECITKEEAQELMSKGILYSFIPKHLDVPDRPELSIFPFNVMFARYRIQSGKTMMGSSIYEPNLKSYSQLGEECSMQYVNAYGPTDWLVVKYDRTKKCYSGTKIVKGEKAGTAIGTEWKTFFVHFTALGLAQGEKCMLEPVES